MRIRGRHGGGLEGPLKCHRRMRFVHPLELVVSCVVVESVEFTGIVERECKRRSGAHGRRFYRFMSVCLIVSKQRLAEFVLSFSTCSCACETLFSLSGRRTRPRIGGNLTFVSRSCLLPSSRSSKKQLYSAQRVASDCVQVGKRMWLMFGNFHTSVLLLHVPFMLSAFSDILLLPLIIDIRSICNEIPLPNQRVSLLQPQHFRFRSRSIPRVSTGLLQTNPPVILPSAQSCATKCNVFLGLAVPRRLASNHQQLTVPDRPRCRL